MFVVCLPVVTEAKYSVDGKKHTYDNYYTGLEMYSFGAVVAWGSFNNAVIFTSKREADKVAKHYNAVVKEIS